MSISDKAESRSDKQNRLMHQWFRDIHNMTRHGLTHEAGRCKHTYFLPVMEASTRESAVEGAWIIREIEKLRGYEYVINALGASSEHSTLKSTRLLTTKEFAMALTEMQAGEYMHCLTDPSTYGLDMGRWE